jgi:hypothetical protein
VHSNRAEDTRTYCCLIQHTSGTCLQQCQSRAYSLSADLPGLLTSATPSDNLELFEGGGVTREISHS